jgi:hypothetical protein
MITTWVRFVSLLKMTHISEGFLQHHLLLLAKFNIISVLDLLNALIISIRAYLLNFVKSLINSLILIPNILPHLLNLLMTHGELQFMLHLLLLIQISHQFLSLKHLGHVCLKPSPILRIRKCHSI